MDSKVERALIANRSLDGAEAASAADVPLSEKLERLAALHGEIAWPESVATAMAELEAATRRLARRLERVSDATTSLGEVAADLSPPPAGSDQDQPGQDTRGEPT